MKRASVAALLIVASWLFAWGSAASQVLRDPTEPPWGAGAASPSMGSSGTSTALQSVIVSQGRKLALIDGRMYQTGDKVGDATIASISADEVTLRGPEGIKVLKLVASLKKPTAGSEARPAGGKGGS